MKGMNSLMKNMIACSTISIRLKNKWKKVMSNNNNNKNSSKNKTLNNKSKTHKKNPNKNSHYKKKKSQSLKLKLTAIHSSKKEKNLLQHNKNKFEEEWLVSSINFQTATSFSLSDSLSPQSSAIHVHWQSQFSVNFSLSSIFSSKNHYFTFWQQMWPLQPVYIEPSETALWVLYYTHSLPNFLP